MQIKTLDDLQKRTREDFLQNPKFGPRRLNTLENAMAEEGIKLKTVEEASVPLTSLLGLSGPARNRLQQIGIETVADLTSLTEAGLRKQTGLFRERNGSKHFFDESQIRFKSIRRASFKRIGNRPLGLCPLYGWHFGLHGNRNHGRAVEPDMERIVQRKNFQKKREAKMEPTEYSLARRSLACG